MSDARTSDDPDATGQGADEYGGDRPGDGRGGGSENPMARWLASTAVRWTLVVVGFVLLLFALGQAFDTPFLGWIVDAAASETGRWLVVALVALGLIVLATDAPWDSWN